MNKHVTETFGISQQKIRTNSSLSF